MGLVNLENDVPSDDIANWFLKEIRIKGDWAEERIWISRLGISI